MGAWLRFHPGRCFSIIFYAMTDFSQTQASSVLPVSPTPWWKSGLFWRTFFLVGILLMVSMGAWIASFRIEQRGPRARQVADQIVSLVTITRAALAHSAPELRRELLFDLASNEGIRIYPLEPTDKIDPVTDGDDLMSFIKIWGKIRSFRRRSTICPVSGSVSSWKRTMFTGFGWITAG